MTAGSRATGEPSCFANFSYLTLFKSRAPKPGPDCGHALPLDQLLAGSLLRRESEVVDVVGITRMTCLVLDVDLIDVGPLVLDRLTHSDRLRTGQCVSAYATGTREVCADVGTRRDARAGDESASGQLHVG